MAVSKNGIILLRFTQLNNNYVMPHALFESTNNLLFRATLLKKKHL